METFDGFQLMDHDINTGVCLYRAIKDGFYTVRIEGMVIIESSDTRITHHFTDYNKAIECFTRFKKG